MCLQRYLCVFSAFYILAISSSREFQSRDVSSVFQVGRYWAGQFGWIHIALQHGWCAQGASQLNTFANLASGGGRSVGSEGAVLSALHNWERFEDVWTVKRPSATKSTHNSVAPKSVSTWSMDVSVVFVGAFLRLFEHFFFWSCSWSFSGFHASVAAAAAGASSVGASAGAPASEGAEGASAGGAISVASGTFVQFHRHSMA